QYSWDNAGTLDDATIANPVASPIATTTYTVTVTSAGCTATGSVEGTVGEPLIADVTASEEIICAGEEITISAVIDGGGAPYEYSWSPGGETTDEITVSPMTTTEYTLTVTDACGGEESASVTITVNP